MYVKLLELIVDGIRILWLIVNTDGDPKQAWYMMQFQNFHDFNDWYGFEYWDSHFEYFFYSFILAYEKKGLFVQLKFRMEKLLIGS